MSAAPASVVIPTYNRSETICRAVDSVLAAVDEMDEVIVVDDGSTDGTDRVLERYGEKIRYIQTANGGAGKARNRGIEESRHPLVAFLDSDDEWMPDRLLLGRRLLARRPDVLFCFSDFGARKAGQPDQHGGLARWNEDRRPWDQILGPGLRYSEIAELPPDRSDFAVHIGALYGELLESSYVAAQTLLVRRPEAGEALRFAEDLSVHEDWECAARLARAGRAAYLDCETAWQWGHEAPRLTNADEFHSASARITMIERIWGCDATYLANNNNAERVARSLRDAETIRARWLLRQGRNQEAREAFRRAGGIPMVERLLAAMPGFLTRDLLAARALLLRMFRRVAT